MRTSADPVGLESLLRARLGERHPVCGAAVVTATSRHSVVVGAAPAARFEIGSVTKGLTGLLYVDAVERGEVTPQTRLDELLPLSGCPAGAAALGSLSTHTSGLPRLPSGSGTLRRSVALLRDGTNPYGEDLPALLDQARLTKVGRPRRRYSNFGFELLGHAVARGAGTTYPDLLRGRLGDPLGLGSLAVPASAGELGPEDVLGRSRLGRVQEAWVGEALGPAGGVRASVGDLGVLVAALLDRTAPGLAALDPVRRFVGPGLWIGAAWFTTRRRGHEVTWHDGGTGGFRTWVGLDRDAGVGAAVVTATSRWVNRVGEDLVALLRT